MSDTYSRKELHKKEELYLRKRRSNQHLPK